MSRASARYLVDSIVSVRQMAIKTVAHRCKSQYCPVCAKGQALSRRVVMQRKCRDYQACMMLTLTLDPSRFESPRAAWESVQKNRRVARLIKDLHDAGYLKSRKWQLVIEWHESGWPHYHLLVDSRRVPKNALQRLWRVGHVWYTRFGTVKEKAVNYLTKYLSKLGEVPRWVLDCPSRLRRYSASRDRVADAAASPKEGGEGGAPPRKMRRRTVRDRLRSCGTETVVLMVEDNYVGYIGTIPIPFDEIAGMSSLDVMAFLVRLNDDREYREAALGVLAPRLRLVDDWRTVVAGEKRRRLERLPDGQESRNLRGESHGPRRDSRCLAASRQQMLFRVW